MAAILRIKNPETGEFEDIKALVGPQGPKGDTPPLSNIEPSSLGTASPGTATNASREDHVHPMPTANDVGALPVDGTAEDSSKLNGQEASYYATEQEVSKLKNDIRVNLLRPTLQTTTLNGVTFTNNGDGTYTLNGTATEEFEVRIADNIYDIKEKYCSYITEKYVDGVWMALWYAGSEAFIVRNKTEITITDELDLLSPFLHIKNGTVINNLVIKPMLTDDLSATYDGFVSYDDSLVKVRDAIDKASIGDAWMNGKTYAVGDYCIRGNRLYKCKTAHTTGNAFNSDYWDAVSVAGEIGSLKFGNANIYSAQNKNVNSITIDTSPVMNDLYSVFFVLLLRDWASSNSFAAIGCFNMFKSYNTGLPGDAYIIADPGNLIASMETSRENATFTVNLQSNFSYVKLIYISHM